MRSQTTRSVESYSTTESLRNEIHNLVNENSDRGGPEIRSLATNLHFDVEDDDVVLTDVTDELFMITCSATFRDELNEDQRAVVGHAAELASLLNRCMRDGTGTDEADVIYYARKLSKQRKETGLIHYEDICGK